MERQSIKTTLALLDYHLTEVIQLSGRPSWAFFEYKLETLKGGIKVLENIKECPDENKKLYETLLSAYREEFMKL
jgi:hypothetical protein